MDAYLNALINIEKDLLVELNKSPLFIRLESIRKTIKDFQGNGAMTVNGANSIKPNEGEPADKSNMNVAGRAPMYPIPPKYDPKTMTWKERAIFLVNKTPQIGLAEIIKEIQLLEPNLHTKKFLSKRMGVTVSNLKTEGFFDVKSEDGRYKYFIKKGLIISP